MNRSWLLPRLAEWGERDALVGDGWSARYPELVKAADQWGDVLTDAGVATGQIVGLDGDYSLQAVALLIALIERACTAVPLTSAPESRKAEFLATAGADFLIDCRGTGSAQVSRLEGGPRHPLMEKLAGAGSPGLVLFSSGSTGQPKAVLHDFDRLLRKFRAPRQSLRMLSFLLLDHIGGINTLFFGLANGGTVISVSDRRPESICQAIERNRVEVLPTSPTFLNLLLLSEAHLRHDLSSLRLITYGTELMPASTLERLHEALPNVRLQQTYGLSELGILRSKSREDGSLWVKVGGEDYETKVVNGVLWVRAQSAMLGYLNAQSPFDAEGWFNTEDAVEQDGEWLRFLGRTSEIINVGGQKVYPAEVESVLLEMDEVCDVTIRGERNPLLGQHVVAVVNLRQPEPALAFKTRMRRHCQGRLAPYMVPLKVEVTAAEQFNARWKRVRHE